MTGLDVLRRNPLRQLSPNQLLFKDYCLDRTQKLIMICWGIVLSQLASPVGNSVYFIFFQTRFAWSYPTSGTVFADWYLKDLWDRLPVHLANLLHQRWFHSQTAPAWWVVARHDARHVIIGIVIVMLVSLVTVGMGRHDHKPIGTTEIILRCLATPLAAVPGAAAGILFFTHVWPGVMHVGFANSTDAWLVEWLGKGSWQLTAIGILAGLGAKVVFRPVAAMLQLASIDNKLMRGETERWWWRLAYTPAYRRRFNYLRASADHTPRARGRLLGFALAAGSILFVLFLAFGIWVRYFGPAAGVS